MSKAFKWKLRHSTSWTLVPQLLCLLTFARLNNLMAVDAYRAIGYLIYARLNGSGIPSYKEVMMFDVKVRDDKWRIRTEPVIECSGGIGFYEACVTTNESVLKLTCLREAYKSSESPFQVLRAELKESRKEDVYFTNIPTKIPAAFSNVISGASSSVTSPTDRLKNVAVAVSFKGKYPPVDPSFINLIWLAFTPPEYRRDGTNIMLLQAWDDGNPQKTRFRGVMPNQFDQRPFLLHKAVYHWSGKELLTDGAIQDIKASDVSNPLDTAAIYDVTATTNVNGRVLPGRFKLTRFTTKRSANGDLVISTTVTGFVIGVTELASGEPVEISVPGPTVMTDYRVSDGDLNGAPLRYLVKSNLPPTSEELKGSVLYKQTLRTIHD